MRNDVPDGAVSLLVPPAGVEKAGEARGRVLIERLRAEIRALEQVPVSLAIPPAPGTVPPRPACSFSPEQIRSLLPRGETREHEVRAEGSEPQTQNPLLTLPHKGRGIIWTTSSGTNLPLNHLTRAGLHEIRAAAYRDYPAALCFALAAMAEQAVLAARKLVLWCLTKEAAREWGQPYGAGLLAIGLDPASFLFVEARNAEAAAWALEEGLKSGTLIAALAAVEIKTPLVARRLGLAAKESRTPCLLLSGQGQASLPGTVSRWRIAARTSRPTRFDSSAPGSPVWELTLERCLGEAPGKIFIVEFSHESFRLDLSAAVSDRTAEAGEDRRGFAASRR